MTYPKPLATVSPKRGFVSDVPAHAAGPDYYTNCRNVIFRDGIASRLPGSREAYGEALAVAAPTQLLHAINAPLAATNYWLLFEADGTAWAIEGQNATQIDGALLQATTQPYTHSSCLLNGTPCYSNGVDEPVYWAGANLVTLPDWTATETCQFIAAGKFHLFAMDISGPGGTFGNLVKWSDAASPGTIPQSWTPAAGNDSGSTELADSKGSVLCAYPLGEDMVFYKRNAMYRARFVGGNNVWQFTKARSASGALSPHSVCDISNRHFAVTDGDIVITDGTNRQPLGEQRVKDWLFRQLDSSNFRNLFCAYNSARNEVLIGFPESGNQFASLGLVYDIAQDSFGVRELAQVAAAPVGYVDDSMASNTWSTRNDPADVWAGSAQTEVWGQSGSSDSRDSVVLVKADQLVQQDTSDQVSLQATLGKNSMDFGEPARMKFIRRVHVKTAANSGSVLVRVGGQMTPEGPTTWSNEVQLDTPDQIANCQAIGRYISVEIRTINAAVWRITGFELEGELRGYF